MVVALKKHAENITCLELPGYRRRALKKSERGDIGFFVSN